MTTISPVMMSLKQSRIKKMPKNLLSPQQAVKYSQQIFLPSEGNRHFQSFQIDRSKLRDIKPNLKIKFYLFAVLSQTALF
jgi:hypothetical protein